MNAGISLPGILTVDPGMNTGWAFWSGFSVRPTEYGQVTVHHQNLSNDLTDLFRKFEALRKFNWRIQRVALEYPGAWAGSATSAASVFSGDLIKLAALVGGYAAIASRVWGAEVSLIPPHVWMKSMSKDAVKFRVQRATGIDVKSSHINDAIGIGLHLKNRLSVANESRPFVFKSGVKP